jgi:predicted pyridoxine 5'-phosphate oxidase superfamily flavin-nucleotide-binding protein
MKIPQYIKEFILNADSKALATFANENINVVPVSVIKIQDENIILLNFFMGKTVENIKLNNKVAIVFWKGLDGYQIKCEVKYLEEGEMYENENKWSKENFPERMLKGVLILEPKEIFDVALTNPGAKIELEL